MSGIYEYLAGMLPRLALSPPHSLSLSLGCLFSSHEAETRGRLESHKLHSTRAGFVTEKVNTERQAFITGINVGCEMILIEVFRSLDFCQKEKYFPGSND